MKSLFKTLIGLVLCAQISGIFLTTSVALQLTTSKTYAPQDASAIGLPDGRVLITGGVEPAGTLASATFLNGDGESHPVAPMLFARSKHAAVALLDGRVLVTGGDVGSGATSATEIYDPASDQWIVGPPMIASRFGHTASLLLDGRVLIAGGAGAGAPGVTLEVYDPSEDRFFLVGVLTTARRNHAAAVLSDGRVLIIGGLDGDRTLASSEIYDPASGVSYGPSLFTGRAKSTATTLGDGRVLVAGGSDGQDDLASVEIYDAATNRFSFGPVLSQARSGHYAFRLSDDTVLFYGGAGKTLELYSPPVGNLQAAKAFVNESLGNAVVLAANGDAPEPPSLTGVDLSRYVRVGRYDLPEPTRTVAPPGSLLAQEVSAVTYNPDTDSLFVVGDGGTSVVQVTKTGQLIDSMTLASGGSPQGTEFLRSGRPDLRRRWQVCDGRGTGSAGRPVHLCCRRYAHPERHKNG